MSENETYLEEIAFLESKLHEAFTAYEDRKMELQIYKETMKNVTLDEKATNHLAWHQLTMS